jgi:hypothetical protein
MWMVVITKPSGESRTVYTPSAKRAHRYLNRRRSNPAVVVRRLF